jgi:hypothetical protein
VVATIRGHPQLEDQLESAGAFDVPIENRAVNALTTARRIRPDVNSARRDDAVK